MSEGLELSIEDIEAEMAGVTFYDRAGNAAFIDKATEGNIYSVVERAQKFWMDEGIIKSEIDIDSFISAEYFG